VDHTLLDVVTVVLKEFMLVECGFFQFFLLSFLLFVVFVFEVLFV